MKMFLNVQAEAEQWSEDKTSCFLVIKDNPLAEYVILPVSCQDKLWYSNILCGMIRGALEQISIVVKATFVQDVLHGDGSTVISVQMVKMKKEANEDD